MGVQHGDAVALHSHKLMHAQLAGFLNMHVFERSVHLCTEHCMPHRLFWHYVFCLCWLWRGRIKGRAGSRQAARMGSLPCP